MQAKKIAVFFSARYNKQPANLVAWNVVVTGENVATVCQNIMSNYSEPVKDPVTPDECKDQLKKICPNAGIQ